jgi:hypothetical protein
MKKSDLKQLIKPLVKECIHEVLLEEGLLSNIVSEVAQGMQGNLVVESKEKAPDTLFNEELRMKRQTQTTNTKFKEHRKKLMDAVGSDAYNGVNLFEGTDPMTGYDTTDSKPGSVDLGHPSDAGVDISSLVGGASEVWKAIK